MMWIYNLRYQYLSQSFLIIFFKDLVNIIIYYFYTNLPIIFSLIISILKLALFKKIPDIIISCVFSLCYMKILNNLLILFLIINKSMTAAKLSSTLFLKEKRVKDYSFVTCNISQINSMFLFCNVIFEFEKKSKYHESTFFFSQIWMSL